MALTFSRAVGVRHALRERLPQEYLENRGHRQFFASGRCTESGCSRFSMNGIFQCGERCASVGLSLAAWDKTIPAPQAGRAGRAPGCRVHALRRRPLDRRDPWSWSRHASDGHFFGARAFICSLNAGAIGPTGS